MDNRENEWHQRSGREYKVNEREMDEVEQTNENEWMSCSEVK